jgi:hypothetical protein
MASSGVGRFLLGMSRREGRTVSRGRPLGSRPGAATAQHGETRSLVTLGRHLRVTQRAETAVMYGWPLSEHSNRPRSSWMVCALRLPGAQECLG